MLLQYTNYHCLLQHKVILIYSLQVRKMCARRNMQLNLECELNNIFQVLRFNPRALHTWGKCCQTELHPQPLKQRRLRLSLFHFLSSVDRNDKSLLNIQFLTL